MPTPVPRCAWIALLFACADCAQTLDASARMQPETAKCSRVQPAADFDPMTVEW